MKKEKGEQENGDTSPNDESGFDDWSDDVEVKTGELLSYLGTLRYLIVGGRFCIPKNLLPLGVY